MNIEGDKNMDALDIEISQIKNLNMIYLYNIDNALSNRERKYIGLQVTYNNHKSKIDLDFKDKHFADLLKKVMYRYNQEKDKRNIVLLGDLSEALFEDDEILETALKRNEFNSTGRKVFGSMKELIKPFLPYLKEIITLVLTHIRGFEGIEIQEITGYNKRFTVHYSIVGIKKEFPITLYFSDENTLNFQIGFIEGKSIGISGYINNDIDKVSYNFNHPYEKYEGNFEYDLKAKTVEKNILLDGVPIYESNESDTITKEDTEVIKFYLELFEIAFNGEVLKTDDNNFLLGTKTSGYTNLESKVTKDTSIQIFISDDGVYLKYRVKNCLNKLKYKIDIPLDFEDYEITLKRIDINNRKRLIVECITTNNIGKKYDYVVYETNNIDFKHPFEIKEKEILDGEIKSLYDIEKKLIRKEVRKVEGGEN